MNRSPISKEPFQRLSSGDDGRAMSLEYNGNGSEERGPRAKLQYQFFEISIPYIRQLAACFQTRELMTFRVSVFQCFAGASCGVRFWGLLWLPP